MSPASIADARPGGEARVPVVLAAETHPGSFPYPESAARALGRAVERAEWLRRPAGTIPQVAGIDRAEPKTVARALAAEDDVWLAPAGRSRAARVLWDPYRPGAIGRPP